MTFYLCLVMIGLGVGIGMGVACFLWDKELRDSRQRHDRLIERHNKLNRKYQLLRVRAEKAGVKFQ